MVKIAKTTKIDKIVSKTYGLLCEPYVHIQVHIWYTHIPPKHAKSLKIDQFWVIWRHSEAVTYHHLIQSYSLLYGNQSTIKNPDLDHLSQNTLKYGTAGLAVPYDMPKPKYT